MLKTLSHSAFSRQKTTDVNLDLIKKLKHQLINLNSSTYGRRSAHPRHTPKHHEPSSHKQDFQSQICDLGNPG